MLETDGDNSSNSFMLDGINDRSRISAHEDAIDGIFTNYIDLRSFMVTEKTITQLLELLDTSCLMNEQIWSTLEKISQCVASAIAFLGSVNHFKEILKFVENYQQ